MYGLLRLDYACLKSSEQDVAAYHLCSLCHHLAERYGFLFPILSNHDSAFISTLYTAQCPEAFDFRKCSRPIERRDFSSHKGTIFGSAISILIANAKASDDLIDDGGIKPRLLSKLLRAKLPHAYQDLREIGFDPRRISSQILEQRSLEERSFEDVELLARPTANAFSYIFSHTSEMSGMRSNIDAASELGRNVGRLMYISDSYSDLEEDISHNRFNPFSKDSKNPVKVTKIAKELTSDCLAKISASIKELEIRRFKMIVGDALVSSLGKHLDNLFNAAVKSASYRMFANMMPSAPRIPSSGRYHCIFNICCDC